MTNFVARFLLYSQPMKHFLFLLLLISFSAQAQLTLKGVVKSEQNRQPLPFATLTSEKGRVFIADVDGKFSLPVERFPVILKISYTGFKTLTVTAGPNIAFHTFSLQPEAVTLQGVAVSNVANGIIEKAISLKKLNDPEQKLSGFEFKSYNKLVITANPDSIDGRIEQIRNLNGHVEKPDSSNYNFKQLVARRHLFQMEKTSDFQFSDGVLKETITGTKMGGFTQPVYEVVGFSQQSFSVYRDRYELMERKYLSPLADNARRYYFYKLLDTVAIDGRKTFLIYFRAKKTSMKNPGLKGLLYIDTETFGIAKAVMRINSVLDISAVHEFDFIPAEQLWFPSGREFKIVKGKNDDDIKIFGATLKFDGDADDKAYNRKKEASDFTYLLSKSWFSDREYNVPIHIRRAGVAIEIKDDAIRKDENFWNSRRKDTTDYRSDATYQALDSISQKRGIERKLRLGRKIVNGYVPLGPVDLDLRYLLSYNNYEGFRVGLGGITSDSFSRVFRIDGYTAYGTKDGELKYSVGAAARVGKFSASWIGANYTDDVKEIASTSFVIDKRVFKIYDPRPINVSTFYSHKTWRGYIETKIIPKTESVWQLTHSDINPLFDYTFTVHGKSYRDFSMTTAMVALQWNPFSDFMQTPSGRLEIEKQFPKFTFQFTQSLPGIWDNDFHFNKFDLRGEYEIHYLDGQKTSFLTEAGYANGDVPITHLYNTSPNNLTKDRLLQRITLAGKNSFETMYFNEFFSSRYAMFQLKHGLKRFTMFPKVRPALVFVTRMAWGSMEHVDQHQGITYKTLDKGYFESGMELNQIFKGFGISGFYRYGPNQLPRFENNLAVKLSFVLDLGL